MDFDSSTKFISSLAKFLQSLCNGYVEFDNGVEVIGHIYLSVDTGKKIDYILNEKVCKTDENSVTFISNSFHAQPAEKPKPPPVKNKTPEKEVIDDDDIILMDEPESTNTGTVPPPRDNSHSHHQNNVSQSNFNSLSSAHKRPYSHNFSHRPSKHRKTDSSSTSNPNGAPPVVSTPSNSQEPNTQEPNESSFNLPSDMSTVTAASESDLSHLSQVLTDNNSSKIDDCDVKPILDSDLNVVNVKQEYDPSAEAQDSIKMYNEQDEASYYSGMSSHDQSYDMGNSQYYGGRRGALHSEYGEMSSGDMYQGGAGPGDSGGSMMGDSQAQDSRREMMTADHSSSFLARMQCPVSGCNVNMLRLKFRRHWLEKHETRIKVFCCSLCPHKSKRRADLVSHITRLHGPLYPPLGVGVEDCEEVPNKHFIDPHPYTYNGIMAKWQMN